MTSLVPGTRRIETGDAEHNLQLAMTSFTDAWKSIAAKYTMNIVSMHANRENWATFTETKPMRCVATICN